MRAPAPFLLMAWATACLNHTACSQSAFTQIVEEHQLVGISVVTRCGDAVSIEAHAGLRDIERDLPVNANTTYRMASISKGVVALVVAKLVEDGTLAYDAPLAQYLDSPPIHPGYPEIPLTVNHLLTHTSGIRDGSGYSDFLSASYTGIPDVPALGSVLDPGGEFYTENMWGTSVPGEWYQYANLNFGVLATVMEGATGMRFDEMMEAHLFGPFGINAGYRVQDLDEINDLAVLYRQYNGNWAPQADQYQGVMPDGPDWSGYLPGTNAVCFSPQGGLRISAEDLTLLARLWSAGSAPAADGLPLAYLSEASLADLTTLQWEYSGFGGGNGNNYYGLFNAWARGLHLAASGNGNDEVIPDVAVSPFIGHPGEAYGLISDAYSTPDGSWNFAFCTNGKWDGFSGGPASAYYAVEQDVFAALRDDFLACSASRVDPVEMPDIQVLGLHRAGDTTLRLGIPASWADNIMVSLVGPDGREVARPMGAPDRTGLLYLDTPPLPGGWLLGRVQGPAGTPPARFLLVVGH